MQQSKWKRSVYEPSSARVIHGNRKNGLERDKEFLEKIEDGQIWFCRDAVNGTEVIAILRDENKLMLRHLRRERVTKVRVSHFRNHYKHRELQHEMEV